MQSTGSLWALIILSCGTAVDTTRNTNRRGEKKKGGGKLGLEAKENELTDVRDWEGGLLPVAFGLVVVG